MSNYHILHGFTEIDLDRALEEVSQLPMQRYDNPFERKWFLAHKHYMLDSTALSWALDELRQTTKTASQLLNLPLYYIDWQHYGGLFRYDPGDYLAPHVDAGIHPNKLGHRKLATIVLYLTDAVISFWQGDSCLESNPEVWLEQSVGLKAGDAIVFANHDEAWHSVPVVQGPPRVCMTVSYMAYDGFKHSRYQNPRTRAYFAKRHGVPDTPEVAALRVARASEDKTEREGVYRWTGNTK